MNMMLRTASVSVDVPRDWLTDDGDYTEEEGWKEVEDEITRALDRYRFTTGLKVRFSEWADDAEEAS